ncbi:unnamed protein product [Fusarium graminearum]|uniref:Uncharacterized protein n=1 Tax=Gibberella zeae TaxID=5518 RepID=A0A4E9EGV3_GIBZA|nr:unnamed protein product [Fusarium graminearum]CAF3520804.1 unnamed protein product [Fusarium graminearum]CAG1960367.1 unnamed protein product [Fusarium graminearum]CAG1987642.1 unnamed protein product [Fusarium graminearum]
MTAQSLVQASSTPLGVLVLLFLFLFLKLLLFLLMNLFFMFPPLLSFQSCLILFTPLLLLLGSP